MASCLPVLKECCKPFFHSANEYVIKLAHREDMGPARWFFVSQKERWRNVQVLVRDNNVDQALKALKKKMQREGVFREMKLRRNYEKPSEKRARESAEAVRRARKLERKRLEREGF
jgi:small subunit ribosomal protein S21